MESIQFQVVFFPFSIYSVEKNVFSRKCKVSLVLLIDVHDSTALKAAKPWSFPPGLKAELATTVLTLHTCGNNTTNSSFKKQSFENDIMFESF